jgi:uncharacterized protein
VKIVFNSSPLIFLIKLNFLEIFLDTDAEFYIPDAVIQEIQAKNDDTYEIITDWIERGKFQVKKTGLQPLLEHLNENLGRGESEAICLSIELQANRVILDDLAARKTAINLGLNVKGTLAIIKKLTQSGQVGLMNKDELYHKLRSINFRLSRSIFNDIFSD